MICLDVFNVISRVFYGVIQIIALQLTVNHLEVSLGKVGGKNHKLL